MKANDLILPTIHSGGTSKEELLNQLHIAASAVAKAIECVSDATPHHRDYIAQPDNNYGLARDQHADRMERLRSTWQELHEMYEALENK
jgi:hypothetical protein